MYASTQRMDDHSRLANLSKPTKRTGPPVDVASPASRSLCGPGMIKNVFVVGLSSSFVVGSSFLRGVILARVLGPHEYGLALILISITAALDVFADAGIDRFIVQNRFGRRRDVMGTSHGFRVAGSGLVGLAIVAVSYPLSRVFHAPELVIAIALTGGVVTLRGFVNLSYKLQQRDRKFGAETRILMAASGVDLAVTTIVALKTGSFWAVLAGAYANATVHVILSHLLAEHSYSFIMRRRLIRLVGRFSLPIYINAIMLVAAVQGDRMVVAASYSKSDLAFYAAACAIGQGLVGLASTVTMNTLLPVLAARGAELAARRRQNTRLGVLFVGGSTIFLLGLSAIGAVA